MEDTRYFCKNGDFFRPSDFKELLNSRKTLGDIFSGKLANTAGMEGTHRKLCARFSDRLGGYSTLDLRLEYAIAPAWTLQAKVGNVFDRDYETVAWYNQAGRTYGLSLRYQPQD